MKRQLKYIKESKELSQLNDKAKNILESNLKDKIKLYKQKNNKANLRKVQKQQKHFQSKNVASYLSRNDISFLEFKRHWYQLVKENDLDKSDILLFNIYLNTFLYYLSSNIFGKRYYHILLLLWILPVTELYFLSMQNEFHLSTNERILYYIQEEQKRRNPNMFIIDGDLILKSIYRRNSKELMTYMDVYFKQFQREYDIHQFIQMNDRKRRAYSKFLGNLQKLIRLIVDVEQQSIDIL